MDAIDTLVMILFFIGCAVLGLGVLKCVVVGAKCQFAWTKEKGVFRLGYACPEEVKRRCVGER